MKHDKYQPRWETIAGLDIIADADMPFGKHFQMGHVIYTIYDRAIENGYQAGVQSHLALIREMQLPAPFALDLEQFTALLSVCTPRDLGSENAGLWRAHFIAGWSSVFLGLTDLSEVLHTGE